MNIVKLEEAMDIFLYDLGGYEESDWIYLMPYLLKHPLSKKSDLLKHQFVIALRSNPLAMDDIQRGCIHYSAPRYDDMSIPHLKRIGVIKEPIEIEL